MSNRGFGSSWREIRCLFHGGTVAGLDDDELLERFVIARDETALKALVAKHGPLVLGVCRRILTDSAAADDAFQATFLVLVDRAGSIRGRDRLATWLHRVARNVALRSKRQSARRELVERNAAVAESHHDPIGTEAERLELRALIDGEIARLPRTQREPVILCYLGGLKHEEAAVELGLSVNQLRGRLDRARDRLQDRLARRGLAPSGNALALLAASPGLFPGLVTTTCRAALAFGAGRVGLGLANASAVALSRGVLKTMMLSKLKLGLMLGFVAMLTAVSVAVSQSGPVVGQKGPPVVNQDPAPTATKREGRRLIDVAGPPADGRRFAPKRDPNLPKPDLNAAPESVTVAISGVIRDLDDRPIAGATVYAVGRQSVEVPKPTLITTVVGKTTTTRDGSYTFPGVKIPTGRHRDEHQAATPYVIYQVQARAPGYGFGWHSFEGMYAINPPDPADIQGYATLGTPVVMDVYLRPEADLKGRVIDENEKPVAGVKVGLNEVNLMDEQGMETTVRVNIGLPEEWPDGLGQTVTDADGRFKLPGLPSESCCWLTFQRPDSNGSRWLFASTLAKTKTNHGQPVRHNGRRAHEVYPRDMTVSMPSPRTIEVRVVADDDGKPVPNIRLDTLGDSQATGVWSGGTSNAEGLVELSLPVGRYKGLCADPDSTSSRYIRTYRMNLDVTAEPKVQHLEFRMKPGFELLLEAIDPVTGNGVPGIFFEIKKSADDPWVLVEPSTFQSGPNSTDANGKIRAMLPPGPGKSYLVRVLVGQTGDPANPVRRLGLPEKSFPYDVIPTASQAFEPVAGNWASFRFLLKKRDR